MSLLSKPSNRLAPGLISSDANCLHRARMDFGSELPQTLPWALGSIQWVNAFQLCTHGVSRYPQIKRLLRTKPELGAVTE